MGKSRKTKAKTSDFQKVKLKIGKRLPKGQNETIAAFKSTSIHLREQLKQKDGSEPTTKRNLNIQELLTQCAHYSGSVRVEAVTGLMELLKGSPDVLHTNLSNILQRTSALILDNEYGVRQKVMQLFRQMFSSLSSSQMCPFFPLINAHIICAMTHLGEPIQQDSLLAVDICLDIYPELIIDSAWRFLPCFVKQIASPSGKASEKYVLITNPSSKRSSQTWRLQVLKRLHRVLETMKSKDNEEKAQHTISSLKWSSSPSSKIFGTSGINSANLSTFRLGQTGVNRDEETGKLDTFIVDLLPLLFQCWVEARPDGFTQGGSLTAECLSMLDCILSICQLLNTLADKISFPRKEIVQHFMPFFPFSLQQQRSSSKNKPPVVAVDSLNVRMCDILSNLDEDEESSNWFPKLIAYVEHCLTSANSVQRSNLLTVMKTLLRKWPNETRNLLDKLVGLFSSPKSSEDISLWLPVLTDIAFSPSSGSEARQIIMQHLQVILPRFLKTVDTNNEHLLLVIIRAINQCASRGNKALITDIQADIVTILESNIWTAKNKDLDDNDEMISELLTLLFWVPNYNRTMLKNIKTIIEGNEKLRLCFLELLAHKVSKDKSIDEGMYVSLLFSLLNCSKEKCNFDATECGQMSGNDNVVQQVGCGLQALGRDPMQLSKLHKKFHSLL